MAALATSMVPVTMLDVNSRGVKRVYPLDAAVSVESFVDLAQPFDNTFPGRRLRTVCHPKRLALLSLPHDARSATVASVASMVTVSRGKPLAVAVHSATPPKTPRQPPALRDALVTATVPFRPRQSSVCPLGLASPLQKSPISTTATDSLASSQRKTPAPVADITAYPQSSLPKSPKSPKSPAASIASRLLRQEGSETAELELRMTYALGLGRGLGARTAFAGRWRGRSRLAQEVTATTGESDTGESIDEDDSEQDRLAGDHSERDSDEIVIDETE